ncbi:MAG: prenyltransferase/squalene oxidase repeat-containing protein [Candidatus Thorarchaeota archaeon]
MPKVDLPKASTFIRSLDDKILRARLESILNNQKPNESVLDSLEEMRKSDGGFAFWDEDISCVTTTLNVVGWFDDLNLQREAIVEKTFDFLLNLQQNDGGWDEIPDVRLLDPPQYMVPGKANTRTWITACCAHWFIRFGHAEPPGTRGCPAEFLVQNVTPSGLIRGYHYASWDAMVMFNYHPGPDSDAFKNLLKAVRENFNPEIHDAVDLAWLLRCLRDADLGPKDNLIEQALDALESMQQANGSWSSAEGVEYSGMATVDVIRVLKDFGRI